MLESLPALMEIQNSIAVHSVLPFNILIPAHGATKSIYINRA